MNAEAEEIVSFGSFRLFPARRLLERSGKPVRLSNRAFDLLVVLVANAPEVVSKSTLLAQVWPDVVVEEGNLRLQMNALRRALDDGDHHCLATFHGRGYCFVATLARTKMAAFQGGGPTLVPAVPSELYASVLPPTNLSRPLGRLIGRDQDLGDLKSLLSAHRLVTIVGTGGIGKTRLATELGLSLLQQSPGGVRLIDLAPVSDPAVVARAAASVVGAQLDGSERAVDAITNAIGSDHQLLIFDNCEYVLEAAANLIAALLGRLPNLSIIATSQEILHIQAEKIYALSPLALPPTNATDVAAFAAVSLFIERIQALDRGFELTAGNSLGITEICRSLGGVPLALEMAAGRVPLLGISGLQSGLGDRLRMLKASPAAKGTRHGTLRATVEWSYGLLDETEQKIFRRIGIFLGSFSLPAMLAVAEADDRWTIVDAFSRLIDKSLVMIEVGEPPRYRLLETLRLFAADKLKMSGEREVVSERHARHVVDYFRFAQFEFETVPDPEWFALYSPEIENLRMALDWSVASPDRHPIALELGGPGLLLLDMLELSVEKRQWHETLVPLIDENTPPATEAALLMHTAFHWESPGLQKPLMYVERAVALWRTVGGRRRLARALSRLGIFLSMLGRPTEAEAAINEAWEVLGDGGIGKTRLTLALFSAMVVIGTGDFTRARRYQLQALDDARAMQTNHETLLLIGLSITEYLDGNVPAAIDWGREALSCAIRAPGKNGALHVQMNLAAFLLADNNSAEARCLAQDAFPKLVDRKLIDCGMLQTFAVLGAYEGRLTDAARLIGFVDADRDRTGNNLQAAEKRLHGELHHRLENGLSTEQRAQFREEGARWKRDDAVMFIQTRWFA